MSFISVIYGNKNPSDYKRGLRPYRLGQWTTAQISFEKAIESRPEHAPSHFKLGMCHFRKKEYLLAQIAMLRALELAPYNTQWNDQLKQVEKYLLKGRKQNNEDKKDPFYNSPERKNTSELSLSNKAKKINIDGKIHRSSKVTQAKESDYKSEKNEAPASKATSSKDPYLMLAYLQKLALNSKYSLIKEIHNDLNLTFGSGKKHTDNLDVVNQFVCEVMMMNGERSDIDKALNFLRKTDQNSYRYFGINSYRNNQYEQALSNFQLLGTTRTNPDDAYWLASTLKALGKKEAAWEVLQYITQISRRAATWKYLSQLVTSREDLQKYIDLLQTWSAKNSASALHRDVAVATSQAAIAASNPKFGHKMLHNSIEYHLNRKGGPSSALPDEVRYIQDEGLPRWSIPFEYLSFKEIDNSYNDRASQFVKDLDSSLKYLNVKLIALQSSSIWMKYGHKHELLNGLIFGSLSKKETSEIIELLSSSYVFSVHTDVNGIRIMHNNGIQANLVYLERDVDSYSYTLNGIELKHSFSSIENEFIASSLNNILIPEDTEKYFKESGFNGEVYIHNWSLQAKNKKIINDNIYISYLYTVWLYSLLRKEFDTEGLVVRELRALGEHNEPYQRLLGRYTIPDVDMIRKDGVKVVLYVSGLDKVSYQANMWIPVLERLGVQAAVVIREKRIADGLIPTNLPIYFLKTMRDVELLEESGVNVVLYPANTQKNIHTLRFARMEHYFINHGESDKVVNQSKFLMAYDKLLVAGPLAERRLKSANLPLRDNQILHVGRPQVELSLNKLESKKTSIKTILYAPTWEGFVEDANYSSVRDLGIDILKHFSASGEYKVLFKPHPYTGYNKNGNCESYLEEMKKICSDSDYLEYIDSNTNIHDVMNKSDLLLTDVSSVLNDYLYTLKPILLTAPGNRTNDQVYEEFPSSKAAYLIHELTDVLSAIDDIHTLNSLYDLRLSVCNDSLGHFDEGSMDRFKKIVTSSINL